jgi:SagB-type dehydrogenase family enzyme
VGTEPAAAIDAERAAGAYANAFKPLDPWIESTGFRTHGLRHSALGRAADARLAEDFLLNTRYIREDRETETSIEAYFTGAAVAMLAELDGDEPAGLAEFELPDGVRLRFELGHALARRGSGRIYTGDPIEIAYLATIIRSGASITREAQVESSAGARTLRFRTAPSGGGLYPIDLYVGAINVSGLERGVYRYQPRRDSLLQVGGEDTIERLMGCFSVREEMITLRRAATVALLVARPWRSMRKYGPRGLRYVLLEAGAIAQNIHLATQALGFASVDCASVVDDEVHETLGLDGLYQTLVHAIILGYAG